MKMDAENRGAPGSVACLNIGLGDLKLSFDKNNPVERIRAARVVTDMLRRGFSLLVQGDDGKLTRAKDFDENTCEYIIADFDSIVAQQEDMKEAASVTQQAGEEVEGQAQREEGPPAPARRGGRTKRVDAGKTSAVAVPRISGG